MDREPHFLQRLWKGLRDEVSAKKSLNAPGQYKHNHYVPEWYQKRFLLPDVQEREFYYLNLQPETVRDLKGTSHTLNSIRRLGTRYCFAQDDLYTTTFANIESTQMESVFFGAIDRQGSKAVQFFTNYAHNTPFDQHSFGDILRFMSTQKLRTPKGLKWLTAHAQGLSRNDTLAVMAAIHELYAATWSECIWLLADASQSATKFIVSDHPVTVYNRECHPDSRYCQRFRDPDIRQHGTHTIFPLSLDKVLILTNLSWIRNPYQSARGFRPNPVYSRPTISDFREIQVLRLLTETEVRQINHIIKRRAHRFVAAAKEEWLYPERFVGRQSWKDLGDGYLLMPDPRSVVFSGEIIIGHRDGRSTVIDEYGLMPGQPGFVDRERSASEWETFNRFKGEFARRYGRDRRGRSIELTQLGPERDSDEMHKHHLALERTTTGGR